MKQSPLKQIQVTVAPSAEEAVLEAMSARFDAPASSWHDRDAGLCEVSVYLEDPTRWSEKLRRELQAWVKGLADLGLDPGPAKVRARTLKPENWAESWKRHFKPLLIGDRLLVRPSWSRKRPRGKQVELVLDPGLSFGTGHHATTHYCLHEVVRLAPESGRKSSLIDVGCGSGILAIAAAKLGFAPVRAFDFDPDAVRVAKENVVLNEVSDRITPVKGDVLDLPDQPARSYDVVLANLMHDLLMDCMPKLAAQVKPGGHLVVAGILSVYFPAVRKYAEKAGLSYLTSYTDKEWESGTFQKPA